MKNYIKSILTITLACILAISSLITCYAHPTAEEHDKELEAVLFERGYSKYQSKTIKEYVTALEYASNLAIDQYGGSGKDKYRELKRLRMGGLPLRFDTIDYSEDLVGNGKKINPNTHRKNTHQGWDIEYGNSKVNKFWESRRTILLGTVNSIFRFGKLSAITGYSDKCNSLAGIIYFVHILGDYVEANSKDKILYLTDLSGRIDGADMIPALQNYIDILFQDQKSSQDYKDLKKGLDDIGEKAGKIVRSTGGVNTDEEFQEYHQYAVDLLELLQEHMPRLLKNEEFFKNVFYPNAG